MTQDGLETQLESYESYIDELQSREDKRHAKYILLFVAGVGLGAGVTCYCQSDEESEQAHVVESSVVADSGVQADAGLVPDKKVIERIRSIDAELKKGYGWKMVEVQPGDNYTRIMRRNGFDAAKHEPEFLERNSLESAGTLLRGKSYEFPVR